jgi:hypothetical protein
MLNTATCRFPSTGMDTRPCHDAMIMDADGDIAALVYEADDHPDDVLRQFAAQVSGDGARVSGIVQFRHHMTDPQRRVMVLDEDRMFDVRHGMAGAPGRHIDGQWLDRMAARVEAGIAAGVDVVVVNRFGPLEVAGRGFYKAIKAASAAQTPLIIGVAAGDFEVWTRFSHGMTLKLPCRLEPALAWWDHISGRRRPFGFGPTRACEYK